MGQEYVAFAFTRGSRFPIHQSVGLKFSQTHSCKQSVTALVREYSQSLGPEEQKKQIQIMTKHGFPKLSPAEMARASAASLHTLAPLSDLIDWILALLDEAH